MRIIGGKYKGRRIAVSLSLQARPTTDFAKENLFNILSNHFDFAECKVLDLYSGTGSIGFEFASRGCKEVDLVETDAHHLRFIRKFKEQLGIENLNLIKGRAEIYLSKTNKHYDIIFADPPYNLAGIEHLPAIVFNRSLLNKGGWFILEHSEKQIFNNHPFFFNKRRYGSVNFSIFSSEMEP